MDLTQSNDDVAFRDMVRTFIVAHLPEDIARRGLKGYHASREDIQVWTRILNAKGWAVPNWPQAYGGPGFTPLQRYIFQRELRLAGCPVEDQAAMALVGPVIYTFATEAQKARYLPAIRNADEFWCQGFSEPNSGSDLASLKTTAVRDGDDFVVNGQKIWTSEAQRADMMFALVRTDSKVKPQAGISFLLIDMKSPGLTVRPIYSINEGYSVNEVFFQDVRVPVENIVGELNKGWGYAKFLLVNERTMSAEVPHTLHEIQELKALVKAGVRAGVSLSHDPLFMAKVARLEIDAMALETSVLRVLHMAEDDPEINAVGSVLKLRGSELRQRVTELMTEALGDYGMAVYPDVEGHDNMAVVAPVPPAPEHAAGVLSRYMFRRATTIYGGSSEILRTIIAKTVLGL
ncbi:MAG: acyl-CoA dehydrogenase family protein [Acidocella sp.]|nr:acyl-CoA dehydrogenase family protein [Acidocella sp.]